MLSSVPVAVAHAAPLATNVVLSPAQYAPAPVSSIQAAERGPVNNGLVVRSAVAPQQAVAFTGLVHIQDLGGRPLRNDAWAGTKGQSRRLEGIQVDIPAEWRDRLGLQYMAHLQGIGDTQWVSSGTFLGTRGQSQRVEGLAFRLTGPDAANYDVCYKVHLKSIGDTGVFANGQFAGTRGQSRRLEAVIISIVPKSPTPYNQAILAYAQAHLGQTVPDGKCADLVNAAVLAASTGRASSPSRTTTGAPW